MKISQIVAMANGGVIGRDNALPWRLSTDLRRFKALTLGKPVVMGRKCYESIGKPLPGRPNIVITRNRAFSPDGVVVVHSLDEALEQGADAARRIGAGEICIIGGGEIYRQAMDRTDELAVTHVLADIAGDTFYPPIDAEVWHQVDSEDVGAGERDEYPTRFAVYRRADRSGT
jgi:dihydrofolate reductase